MMTRFQFLVLALLAIPVLAEASPSRMKIAADSEPGQRMILTGRVLDAAGRPQAGVAMHAYHTDAQGLYRRDSHGDARLRGTLVTANDGSYQIDTIKPAPYPGRDIPAHIHFHLRGPGFDQEETLNLSPALRPGSDGVIRLSHDFRLSGK
jgi:protocatechuate 3,4-dioxygenase beta subunit